MKKLINRVEDVVKEQMEGLVLSRPELQVSYEPRYMWHEPKQPQVALVSGGGSGHEPLHAGFIGEGMLTGACPGEVFTSQPQIKCTNVVRKSIVVKAYCS